MTGYERFQAVLQGRTVDFAPRMPILMHFKARYLGTSYDRFATEPAIKTQANLLCAADFDYDHVDVMSDPYVEAYDFGAAIEFVADGVPRCHIPPLATSMDLSLLKKPDPNKSGRMCSTIKAIEIYKEQVFRKLSIHGWVEGPAAEAADLRGMEQFLLDLYDDPDFCIDLMDVCIRNAICFAKGQIEAGADVIGVGDAICSQIPPDLYRQLIAPMQQRLFSAIHEAGAAVRLHICGSVMHLLPTLAGLEFDILDVDSLTDLATARAALGPRRVLAGNLNPVTDILKGTPDSIRRQIISCSAKSGKPYIVSAGCEIPVSTPYQNLKALCEPITIL